MLLYVHRQVKEQTAKAKKKALDAANKVETARKNLTQVNKRQAAYESVKNSVVAASGDRRQGLEAHSPSGDLKLAYQHLGGVVSTLPNGRKETLVELLLNMMPIAAVAAPL
jgi:hypothetical protein